MLETLLGIIDFIFEVFRNLLGLGSVKPDDETNKDETGEFELINA